MNPIWTPNRPKVVLNGQFLQPYSQYPVGERAYGGAVYPLLIQYNIRQDEANAGVWTQVGFSNEY